MRVLFKVQTPEGQATRTNKLINKLIIGIRGRNLKVTTYTSPADDIIYWDCEGSIKKIMNINRNLARFDIIIQNIFNSKLMQKHGVSKLSKEEQAQLKDMLENHTSIEIIRLDKQDEVNPSDGLTLWQRIKTMFKSKVVNDD